MSDPETGDSGDWDDFETALDTLLSHYVEGTETAREAEHRLQQRAQGLREMYGPATDGDGERYV